MASLFASFGTPTLVTPSSNTSTTTTPLKYNKSWALDFSVGDVVLNKAGDFVIIDGYSAWAQWCVKTVLTERDTYLVYTKGYGVEFGKATKTRGGRMHVQSAVASTITTALKRDKRTLSVGNFSFIWKGDQLQVTLSVSPAVGSELPITFKMTGV